MLREVTILRSLVHANVVRLLDVVGNTERLYLIFEYDKTNHYIFSVATHMYTEN